MGVGAGSAGARMRVAGTRGLSGSWHCHSAPREAQREQGPGRGVARRGLGRRRGPKPQLGLPSMRRGPGLDFESHKEGWEVEDARGHLGLEPSHGDGGGGIGKAARPRLPLLQSHTGRSFPPWSRKSGLSPLDSVGDNDNYAFPSSVLRMGERMRRYQTGYGALRSYFQAKDWPTEKGWL